MAVEEEAVRAARLVEGRRLCAARVDVEPERREGAGVVGAVEAVPADQHAVAGFAGMGERHAEQDVVVGQRAAEGLAFDFAVAVALNDLAHAGTVRGDREETAGLVVRAGGDAAIGRGEDQLVVVDPLEGADVVVAELHDAAGLDLRAQLEHVEPNAQPRGTGRGDGEAFAVGREAGLQQRGFLEEDLGRDRRGRGGRRRLGQSGALQAGQGQGERQRATARDGDR
jgi:hypothetical protein